MVSGIVAYFLDDLLSDAGIGQFSQNVSVDFPHVIHVVGVALNNS